MELGSINNIKPLSPKEVVYISRTVAYDDLTMVMVYRERLDLGINYYYVVK
jgi:hypothetical protein